MPLVDGKTYYKSSMVAAMLTANGARKVTQRPLRAQGLSIREALKRSQTLGDYSVTAQHADTSKIVKAGDIIGCLVRTSDTICLAAMEVLCFEHLSSNEVLSTVTLDDLDGEMTSKYCVACQTLDIVEGATDESDDVNWPAGLCRQGPRVLGDVTRLERKTWSISREKISCRIFHLRGYHTRIFRGYCLLHCGPSSASYHSEARS